MTEREFFLERREAESSAFQRVLDALPKDHFDGRQQPPPGDATQILSDFQQSYRALSERAATVGQEAWQRPAEFLIEGKLMQKPPLGKLLWHLFFDAIHHRGQLSTYIRPMGGKVPSIYGTSGDDPGR